MRDFRIVDCKIISAWIRSEWRYFLIDFFFVGVKEQALKAHLVSDWWLLHDYFVRKVSLSPWSDVKMALGEVM